jgi:hypothetical protein
VGEEWSSTSTTNSGIWRSNVTISQKLESLATGVATINGQTRLELRTPKTNAEDLTPKADIAAQSSDIVSTWSVANSRLTRRTNTSSVTLACHHYPERADLNDLDGHIQHRDTARRALI